MISYCTFPIMAQHKCATIICCDKYLCGCTIVLSHKGEVQSLGFHVVEAHGHHDDDAIPSPRLIPSL